MSDIIVHDVFGNCQKPTGASMGYKREPAFRDEPMHTWWIKGPHGGVHIWARLSKLDGWPTEWIGGVECHWAECPDNGTGWHKPDAPSHSDCWLLGGQCWHDGTSLYFSERIEPRLPHPDGRDPHHVDGLPHSIIRTILVEWFQDRICPERPHP